MTVVTKAGAGQGRKHRGVALVVARYGRPIRIVHIFQRMRLTSWTLFTSYVGVYLGRQRSLTSWTAVTGLTSNTERLIRFVT